MDLLALQILTTGAIIAGAIILIVLERKFPYNTGQRLLREGFFNDFVFYNLVQTYILGLIISSVIEFIDTETSLSRLQLISAWPVWMQLLLFVVVHDLYIYWFHRWQHNSKYLWRLHEAHHSTKDVDWLSGVRSHSFEILINQTVEFLPIVLLGAAPEVALYKGAISAIWGMYIHSNINVKSGILQYVINGPEMHRWHHANEREIYNMNFATKLAIWDWLFGTAYFPKNKKAIRYGLDYYFPLSEEKAPVEKSKAFTPLAQINRFYLFVFGVLKTYIHQHLFAFRRFDQD